MRRNLALEAQIVEKFAAVSPVLDERGRRLWAAAESRSIGYGGDALVSSAAGLARETIRKGRAELARGVEANGRVHRAGAGRPSIDDTQPGIREALERLVDPLTRGDPGSALVHDFPSDALARRSLRRLIGRITYAYEILGKNELDQEQCLGWSLATCHLKLVT